MRRPIAINHYRFAGRTLIQTLLMLPVALPAIVLGLGMLFSLPMLDMDVGLFAATLGHAVLGIPYVISMVLASLASFDRSLETCIAQPRGRPVAYLYPD